ncbi:MAG TPA: SDR family NAD(P)-dependent oxidoreductase [Geodermatophilus sp.]|nr:SDR family NAD(P)-dependent oxidoreductase [Geodermatophilus sp.]
MAAVGYRGGTAVVTGASSGIGAEFARRLAERGSDLVLVARRRERLEALAAEIRAASGVRVDVVPLDLGRADVGEELLAALDGLGVAPTSLVNSAGSGTFGAFHEQAPDGIAGEVAVDVAGLVAVTRALIGPLRAAGTGVLVNVASLAAFQGTPRMAVYAAAKAFVLSFTEALWWEARGTGLRVLALSPGATGTEFFEVAGEQAASGRSLATPREVVSTALAALDRRNPPPGVVVGRANRLTASLTRLAGRRAAVRVVGTLTDRSAAAAG